MAFPSFIGAVEKSPVLGFEQLYRLDLLPQLKKSVRTGSISSYDRSGGNDDGFSGKYSFVRKEAGGLVLADLKGPGLIYRIWTPTPTEDLMEFYFDGETTPRIQIKFRDLFTGQQSPFLAPIAGSGAGGFYSYLPLPFQKSCKVLMRAEKVQFYQINYALYPESTSIESFTRVLSPIQSQQLDRARQLWGSAGADISSYGVSTPDRLEVLKSRQSLAPGQKITLFELARPGRIAGFRLGPAQAFAGKDRNITVRIYWDGAKQPAVLSPVGDFFGYSWGDPAIRSLLVGTTESTNYVYFPMPFDQSAKIELVSEDPASSSINVQAELVFAPIPRTLEEGRFYALWRRENPTTNGEPFTFLKTGGRGQLVGCILQAQGMESGSTPFFEGDDQTMIDGQLAVHGTGSEDFFNGGWYDVPDRWEGRKSFPLSGCLDYLKPLGRSAGYRIMLTDAYSYQESIFQAIEHAPEKNLLPTDYCAVTYFYSKDPPGFVSALPPLAERKVVDFRQIRFSPGWNVPIHAFSFQNVTLAKKTEMIDGEEVRYFSMRASGEDLFGQPFVAFDFNISSAGRYAVKIQTFMGPDQGQVQLFCNESPAGDSSDLFSLKRQKSPMLPLGVLPLQAGSNHLFFKIIGKNSQASGLGFEPIFIDFARID
jgi:hypothetical protein